MSSKDDIIVALDALDAAFDKVLDLPLHSLTWSERIQLLRQIDRMGKEMAAFDRRLLGRLITEAAPAQFGGATWAEVLARRLRISRAEAERRVAAAIYAPNVERPSA
jgi:hypothetical protein